MMEEHYWILLNKHTTGDLTSSEQRELQQWLDKDPERKGLAEDFRKIKKLVDSRVLPEADLDNAWLRMQKRLAEKPVVMPQKLGFAQLLARAAIIIGIGSAAVFTYVTLKEPVIVSAATAANIQRDVLLSDGSQIRLQANSVLVYPESFANAEQRKVTLKGEAFFKVKEEETRLFVVEAGNNEISTSGGSFNIKAIEDQETEIAVLSGSVTLEEKNSQRRARLFPGQSGIIDKAGKITIRKVESIN